MRISDWSSDVCYSDLTAKRKCGAPRRPGTLAKDVPGLSISSVRVEGRALPEIPEARGGRRAGTGSHGRGLGLKRGCLPFGGAHRRCRGCPLACYPERTRREGGEHIAAETEDREDEGARKPRSRRARSEERRVGKRGYVRVDSGGRRNIKKK